MSVRIVTGGTGWALLMPREDKVDFLKDVAQRIAFAKERWPEEKTIFIGLNEVDAAIVKKTVDRLLAQEEKGNAVRDAPEVLVPAVAAFGPVDAVQGSLL